MSKTYHYLASANTGIGFVDNFSSILEPDKKGFTYILKGGPGTGKSTMLKKIGKYFENLGEDVEYFHCSSDFNSLDGVKIVGCNISIIDGTSPHSKDTTLPMINDKIIDLSDSFNYSIQQHENKIKSLVEKKQLQYKIIYKYLSSLKAIEDVNLELTKSLFDKVEFDKYYSCFVSKLNLRFQNKKSNVRKLFLDYFDDKNINSINRFNEYSNVIEINRDDFFNLKMLNNLSDLAINFGYNIIQFFNTITNDISALYIKEIDTFIYLNNNYEKLELNNKKLIKNIKTNILLKNKLINKISYNLNIAINYHKNIEKYYVKAVNFNKINILTDNLINLIKNKLN